MNNELATKLLSVLTKLDERLAKEESCKPERLSPDDAAARLHRKPYTVREWCRLNRIARDKDPHTGRFWIPISEVERLENGGSLRPAQDPTTLAA